MKKAVDSSDWTEAANQMLDSKWARQVPNRANRLIERMKHTDLVDILGCNHTRGGVYTPLYDA